MSARSDSDSSRATSWMKPCGTSGRRCRSRTRRTRTPLRTGSFAQLGVAVEQLKEYVGHELSALSPVELQALRAIYSAIKDGETSWKAVMDSEAEKKAEKEAETKKGARKAPAAPQQAKTAPTATEQASEPAEAETAPAEPTDNDMFG